MPEQIENDKLPPDNWIRILTAAAVLLIPVAVSGGFPLVQWLRSYDLIYDFHDYPDPHQTMLERISEILAICLVLAYLAVLIAGFRSDRIRMLLSICITVILFIASLLRPLSLAVNLGYLLIIPTAAFAAVCWLVFYKVWFQQKGQSRVRLALVGVFASFGTTAGFYLSILVQETIIRGWPATLD